MGTAKSAYDQEHMLITCMDEQKAGLGHYCSKATAP
jgi:hypothetical protein